MIKYFVLDTNILLADANNIYGFDDNTVIITGTTMQELDTKKHLSNSIGYNARECFRILDDLREQGDILKGVELKNGGTLFVEPDGVKQEYLPDGFSISVFDNKIISTCIHIEKTRHLSPVILVSNDISMRTNATICGVRVESYRNDHVEESGYSGHLDLDVEADLINSLYKHGTIDYNTDILYENEFVTLHAGSQSALSMYRDRKLHQVKQQTLFGGVNPLNAMQSYVIHALKAPAEEIPLVFIKGPAGTAKTFLSLSAALDDTMTSQRRDKCKYRKILISRPNAQAADPDFGYLPGDIQAKMTPLLAPYFDNLTELFMKNAPDEDIEQIQMQVQDLFASGVLEVCPLSYIRGRTISRAVIICDEAQNAKKELIRDVITRAGIGTKVIVCGDIEQIDNPLLDRYNNGLTYGIEHMKGSKLTAYIEMPAKASVRSPLAYEAIKKMAVTK